MKQSVCAPLLPILMICHSTLFCPLHTTRTDLNLRERSCGRRQGRWRKSEDQKESRQGLKIIRSREGVFGGRKEGRKRWGWISQGIYEGVGGPCDCCWERFLCWEFGLVVGLYTVIFTQLYNSPAICWTQYTKFHPPRPKHANNSNSHHHPYHR